MSQIACRWDTFNCNNDSTLSVMECRRGDARRSRVTSARVGVGWRLIPLI